jgi:dimethylargininase
MAGARRAGLGYRFGRAIVRRPGRGVVHGLRAEDRGAPDHAAYLQEHAAYVRALQDAGVDVITLPALQNFPDSVFVEDTALTLPEGIVILTPGAPSRRGEALVMAGDARRLGLDVHWPASGGTVDGGDVLITEREVLVGQSARSDRAGIGALERLLAALGYRMRAVQTPPGVLHLKSDCGLLGPDTVLATPRLAAGGAFADYRVIVTPAGEEAAANAVRVNDVVLLAEGFPRTAERLGEAGFEVVTVPASQAALLDGGLSCQSLRF